MSARPSATEFRLFSGACAPDLVPKLVDRHYCTVWVDAHTKFFPMALSFKYNRSIPEGSIILRNRQNWVVCGAGTTELELQSYHLALYKIIE